MRGTGISTPGSPNHSQLAVRVQIPACRPRPQVTPLSTRPAPPAGARRSRGSARAWGIGSPPPGSQHGAFSRGPAVHQVFAARLQPAVLASRIGRYCVWTMVSIWRYHKGFVIRGEVPRVFLCGAVCAGWSWSPNDGCGFLRVLWSHA